MMMKVIEGRFPDWDNSSVFVIPYARVTNWLTTGSENSLSNHG